MTAITPSTNSTGLNGFGSWHGVLK